MSLTKSVIKNTGIVFAGDIIFRFVSLIVMIYLARYLGVSEFGKYNLIFAYLAFFGVLTNLGINEILVRDIARDKAVAPKIIGNVYTIRLILSVFAIFLAIIVATIIPEYRKILSYIFVASMTLIFISFSDLYSTIFQANFKMKYNVVAKLFYKAISAILIFWIIFSGGTLMLIIISLVFSEIIKTLICYLFSRKFLKASASLDFSLWKYILKESAPLALTGFIFIIYYRIDVIMISLMMSNYEVGLYSAAYKLSEPLSLIPYSLMISIFPIMSASFKNSKNTLIKSYKYSMKYLLIVTLPIATIITFFSDKIIFLIYGIDFVNSTSALQILIWSLVFSSMNSVVANLLVSINKQKFIMYSMFSSAITNIILNAILIPKIGYNGASIATVITNIILFMGNFYFISRNLMSLQIKNFITKPILGCLIMVIFLYFIRDFNFIILSLLASVIYILFLYYVKTFSDEELKIMKFLKRFLGKTS